MHFMLWDAVQSKRPDLLDRRQVCNLCNLFVGSFAIVKFNRSTFEQLKVQVHSCRGCRCGGSCEGVKVLTQHILARDQKTLSGLFVSRLTWPSANSTIYRPGTMTVAYAWVAAATSKRNKL